jgi:23S rRNA (guanosine2251-2'-O)-methyltransferase
MRRPHRKRSAAPDPAGGTIVYGWHSAVEALRNPRRRVRRLHATQNALVRLRELGLQNLPAPSDAAAIDRIAGPGAVHQGIVLLCDPLPQPSFDELGDAVRVVVLDQVTDPHNVGAVVRSAAAFGAGAVILAHRHSPAESGVLAKAASGGLEHVALVRVTNLARALGELAEMGFLRLGFDSEHADPLEAVGGAEKVALVLGAEGKGLRRLTREHCDRLVRLDAPGPIKSLNVSNAAAVALYALTRPATGAGAAPT